MVDASLSCSKIDAIQNAKKRYNAFLRPFLAIKLAIPSRSYIGAPGPQGPARAPGQAGLPGTADGPWYDLM